MKILVVEDSLSLQKAYRRMFGLLKHEVIIVGDPLDARRRMEAGFKPDVIISDWDMPFMNGGEFCRVIRESGDATPFYIVSGHARRECEATGWFVKPLMMCDLTKILGE